MIPRLTLGHVRRIRDASGIDLLAISDESVWLTVASDAVWHARVAKLLTGDDLAGNELAEFIQEFTRRITEFFPEPQKSKASDGEEPTNEPGDPWRSVFHAAGVVGVEPWGYSMRELMWMAEGAWRPLSAIVAMVHNVNAEKKDRITADSQNPYSTSPKRFTGRRYRRSDLLDG